MCCAIAAHLMRALELDAAGPVAAGAVHERVHLCAGEAGEEDGLPVQGAAPRQEGLPHTHDVRAVLRLWQPVQGLEHCSVDTFVIKQQFSASHTATSAAGATMLHASWFSCECRPHNGTCKAEERAQYKKYTLDRRSSIITCVMDFEC